MQSFFFERSFFFRTQPVIKQTREKPTNLARSHSCMYGTKKKNRTFNVARQSPVDYVLPTVYFTLILISFHLFIPLSLVYHFRVPFFTSCLTSSVRVQPRSLFFLFFFLPTKKVPHPFQHPIASFLLLVYFLLFTF